MGRNWEQRATFWRTTVSLYSDDTNHPHFNHNAAYQLMDVGPNESATITPFNWQARYTPRVELGYLAPSSNGLRARFWTFDQSLRRAAVDGGDGSLELAVHDDPDIEIDTSDGKFVDVRHSMDLNVLDLEITRQIQRANSRLLLSAGVRYVDMQQKYIGNIVTAAALFDEGIRSIHTFRGTGPTAAVDWVRPSDYEGLSLFASARGSLVFGESDLRQWVAGTANQLWEDSNDRVQHLDDDDILAIGDLPVGFEFNQDLGRSSFYIRTALEYQYWPDAGTGAYMNGEDNDGLGHDPRIWGSSAARSGPVFVSNGATFGLSQNRHLAQYRSSTKANRFIGSLLF